LSEIHSDLNIPLPDPILLTDNGKDEVRQSGDYCKFEHSDLEKCPEVLGFACSLFISYKS